MRKLILGVCPPLSGTPFFSSQSFARLQRAGGGVSHAEWRDLCDFRNLTEQVGRIVGRKEYEGSVYQRLVRAHCEGREVLALSPHTWWVAFGEKVRLYERQRSQVVACNVMAVPHPSGRNRTFNRPGEWALFTDAVYDWIRLP